MNFTHMESRKLMNLQKDHWTQKDYQDFLAYLHEQVDPVYREFHSRLVPEHQNILGIRIPVLKKIAKEISKGNYKEFIKENHHNYYEETMIHGLILGDIKCPFSELFVLLEDFLPYNDNWAINDTVCANLKSLKKDQDKTFDYIVHYLSKDDPWRIRFGLILLLDHYLNDTYIDTILELCHRIHSEEYYVKMAVAWLLSICYIKYPNKTMAFFRNNQLDNWTHNKAIQKTCESLRVTQEEKENLRKLKRKSVIYEGS